MSFNANGRSQPEAKLQLASHRGLPSVRRADCLSLSLSRKNDFNVGHRRHDFSTRVCRLLQAASGHFFHPSAPADALRPADQQGIDQLRHKRISYVRYCVKHLSSCAAKHRQFLALNRDKLIASLIELFHTIDQVVSMSECKAASFLFKPINDHVYPSRSSR